MIAIYMHDCDLQYLQPLYQIMFRIQIIKGVNCFIYFPLLPLPTFLTPNLDIVNLYGRTNMMDNVCGRV